ncbi:uncharacterized protein LOC113302539 [Papaver somniferum]|uniref:uncharacterized protein LOC113302539 n=1 Tax=Papaver somniferum TaxID=3469 RepID=UPI000E6FD59F|nr:uncharacterized protein LOC113302539 [Papaver somniferum]
MMVGKRKNKFIGGGFSKAAPKESNKGDVNQESETSGGSKNARGGDSNGQWQLVTKNKGNRSAGNSNIFVSLTEQTAMDMTGQDKHETINVRICNSSPIINATSGGNVNKSESQLQIREVNNVSGSVSNDVLLKAHQGRNSNRKSYNSINSGNGGVLNDNQVIVSEPINKGKGKIVSTDSNGSRKSDGGQLTVPTNTLSSLSKTIEGFLEGGRPSSLFKTIGGFLEGGRPSSLSKTIESFLEGGRPSCSKSSGGVASNGKSFDRISDGSNNTSGLKASNAGGHRTSEQLEWNVFLDRVNQVLIPLSFPRSNWTYMDPYEYLNQKREELECMSKMWPEATTLVA